MPRYSSIGDTKELRFSMKAMVNRIILRLFNHCDYCGATATMATTQIQRGTSSPIKNQADLSSRRN